MFVPVLKHVLVSSSIYKYINSCLICKCKSNSYIRLFWKIGNRLFYFQTNPINKKNVEKKSEVK